jgi:hypothetical protein
MEADQKKKNNNNNHQVNLVSQEILLETDQKETAAGGTLSSSRDQQSETQQHNLLTALESKIEQLHSVMQNEELEGTIHQVVDGLRQDSEAESEAEKSHTDLHIAVDELKAKLVEKSKQVKSYELALKATTQQLEELALISETRLKNAAEHQASSRSSASAAAAAAAAADEETTTNNNKCQGCQLRKAELLELEDARRQLEITNEILVQGLNARDKLIADLEGAIKQFENQLLLSPQQQQHEALGGALNTLLPEEEEVKCKTCGLSQLELKVLSNAGRQLTETNDALLQRLNGRNQRISELESTVKQFECELQEAQACLQETSLLIAARDKRIQRLEMELLCSAAAAASVTPHDVQQPPCTGAAASQEQSKGGAVNQGANPKPKAGTNPPPSSCAAGQGQQDQQKTPNNSSSVCPGGAVMRKAMQSSSSSSSSPPMMSDTMRHAYEHAKDALQHSVETSLEGGGGAGGGGSHCPIQGAFARMGVCTTRSAQQQEDSTALKSSSPSSHVVQGASRIQELCCQPMIPSHTEFYTHADPATTYRLNRNADHNSSSMISDRLQDVSIPYSTVVELSRQQQQTTVAGISWISDFPQPFHSSSMHATVASRSTSPGGDSSPSQELPPLADVAGSIYHHYPHHTPRKLQY